MDIKQIVLDKLKTEVKAFGFNIEEVKSVAAEIANNLEFPEDAEEEEVTAAVTKVVSAVIPAMKIGQKRASREVEDYKKAHVSTEQKMPKETEETKAKEKGEFPPYVQQMLEQMQSLEEQVTLLKKEKVSTSRRERLKKLLDNTGTYGKRTLKSFDKMTFESEEEFDSFVADVEEDLVAINQERADFGLRQIAKPGAGDGSKKNEITDKELDSLANSF